MLGNLDSVGLLKQVFEDRMNQRTTSHIVLAALMEQYDIGRGIQHKTFVRNVVGNEIRRDR